MHKSNIGISDHREATCRRQARMFNTNNQREKSELWTTLMHTNISENWTTVHKNTKLTQKNGKSGSMLLYGNYIFIWEDSGQSVTESNV